IAQLQVQIVSGPPNNETPYMKIVADVRTGLTFAFNNATSALDFTPALPLTQNITIVILENQIGTDENALQGVLPAILAQVFPVLGDTLGGFPLPSFLGISLQGVEVSRAGQFLSIYTNLN